MQSLREQYEPIAKEYARQFGEIIGADFEFWIGWDSAPGHCAAFDNGQSYTMEEIMYVVDNLPKLIDKYTSREAVGEEIRDWFDYCTDNGTPERLRSMNLFSWLIGLSVPNTRKEILNNDKDE